MPLLAVSTGAFTGVLTQKLYERTSALTWQEFSPQPPWSTDLGASAFPFAIGLSDGKIICAGSKSGGSDYFHYDPATALWTTHAFPAGSPGRSGPIRAWAVSATSVYVSYDGKIDHWDGSAWSYWGAAPGNGGGGQDAGLWGSSDSDLWFVSNSNLGPQVAQWNGASWYNHWTDLGGAGQPTDVWGQGGNVYVVGPGAGSVTPWLATWDGASWVSVAGPNLFQPDNLWGDGLRLWCFGKEYMSDTRCYELTSGAWVLSKDFANGNVEVRPGRGLYGASDGTLLALNKSFGATHLWESADAGSNWAQTTWIDANILDSLGSYEKITHSVSDTIDVSDSISTKLYRALHFSHSENATASDQTQQHATQDFMGSGLIAKRKFEPLVDPLIIRATITAQGRKVLDRAAREGLSVSPVRFTLGTGFENPRWGNEEAASQDATDLASAVLFEGSVWAGDLTLESANPKTLVIRCVGPASAQGVTEILVYAQIRHSLTEDNFREIPFASATVPIWCSTPGQVFVARIVIPLG